MGRGQYDDQGMYCGLSTASEVFLIFTSQLYSCLCNYDAIVSYIDKREVLQQEYSQPPILPSSHFRWVVNDNTSHDDIIKCEIKQLRFCYLLLLWDGIHYIINNHFVTIYHYIKVYGQI